MAELKVKDESSKVPGRSAAVPGRSSAVPGQPGAASGRPSSSRTAAGDAKTVSSAPGQDAASTGRKAKGAIRAEARAEAKANSVFGSTDNKADFGPDYSYRRIRFHKGDELNPYADEQDRRYGMDERVRKIIILAVIAFLTFFVVCILPTNVFNAAVRSDASIGTLASEVAASFQGFILFFTNPSTLYGTYVLTVVVTLLAGAAMGLSGGVFQGAMKNALASPSTLGVTSGGTVGVIIYAVFIAPVTVGATFQGRASEYAAAVESLDVGGAILEVYGSFLASLIGCVAVVFLVMSIALIAGRGKVSNASLIIAGQVFAAAIGVVIAWIRSYLTYHADGATLAVLTNAQSSTFTGAYDIVSVAVFAVPLLACMVAIVAMSSRLTLLAFNEDEARSMGISTTRTRNVMVALCTIMTALVVSFCGVVGFVGFMVPHIARKFIGPDFRFLLPACALMGAIMVCVTFYISELGIMWIPEGSTGVVTSVVGCIAFLVMALKNRGAASGEWL